jgi:hypothetical protein
MTSSSTKPVVLRKRRTGTRLISGGDLLRLGYRAGVARQSAGVRLAMRIKIEHEMKHFLRSLMAILRAGNRKVVVVEDIRIPCRMLRRPLLVGHRARYTRRVQAAGVEGGKGK